MPDQQILVEALDARWRRLRKDWERARRKYSEEAVHDLRVAARRLLAVLDTLRSLVDDDVIDDCRRRVKKSLDALSPLRDTQVQRASIGRIKRRYPQLKAFERTLADRETRLTRKVRRFLKRGPKLTRAIAKAKSHAEGPISGRAVIKVVDERYGRVLRFAKHINPADTNTIHRMRLAFKRFRYTVEVTQPKATFQNLHAFQTMMGEIQDVEVLSGRLTKWAAKKKTRSNELKPVFAELERQRKRRIDAFMRSAHKVHSFWKLKSHK